MAGPQTSHFRSLAHRAVSYGASVGWPKSVAENGPPRTSESRQEYNRYVKDYRDEMELAAEVIAAEDLLERWHAGAGALSPTK